MDANLDNIAKDLYGKLETRFPGLKIGDEHAEVLSKEEDVPKARFFEFEYKENDETLGTITITLDTDDGIVVQISGDLVDDRDETTHHIAYNFIRSLRKFAKNRLLKFDVQNIGKSNLDKRDYEFKATRKEEPMEPMMENKMYGNTKISYQDLGENARLVVKHNQQVNTDLAAGRTMHIDSIYIENAVGERFRYPTKHLNGARALAEHIKHGGTPYDAIGKHITSLSEELAQLRKFKGYVSRNEALSEAMGDITSKVMERIEAVKKQVLSLQRPSYYEQFAEAFEEQATRSIPEATLNDWVDRLTVRTFNEDLKTAFPFIFNLVSESDIPVKELSPDDLLSEESEEEEDVEEAYEEESDADQFESFLDNIVAEGEGMTGILNPNAQEKEKAIDEINDIFKSEVKGGNLNIVNTFKDLIPIPEFLDSFEDTDGELDARSAIETVLTDLAKHSREIAAVLPRIDFSGGDGEVGGQDVPPAQPEAPAAPEPVAAAPAPAPAAPAPVAEAFLPTKHKHIKMAIERARAAGAKLDTTFNIAGKAMTLHDAIEECGMTPMECGFENNGNDLEAMKKFMSGFFNREEKNFTIGGERLKIKLEKEFPAANPEELQTVFSFIDKIDPPSNVKQQNDILRLAGVNDREVDEGGMEMPDFDSMMSQIKGMPGATSTSTSSGSIDGKPASYNDAMEKANSLKFKLPKFGADDSDDTELDFSKPDQIGQNIQKKVGGMMQGMQNKLPAQGGSMDPTDMMKQIMGKINFGK